MMIMQYLNRNLHQTHIRDEWKKEDMSRVKAKIKARSLETGWMDAMKTYMVKYKTRQDTVIADNQESDLVYVTHLGNLTYF